MAFILASLISSPSSLASSASSLAGLFTLDRTCSNDSLKALIVTLLAYPYLFVFFLPCKTRLSSRLNSIGNTGDP